MSTTVERASDKRRHESARVFCTLPEAGPEPDVCAYPKLSVAEVWHLVVHQERDPASTADWQAGS